MSFRVRLTLLVALAIALTATAASAAVWVVAKHELLTQFDHQLLQSATTGHGPSPFDPSTLTTYVAPDGTARGAALPVTARAKAVATGKSKYYFTDASVKDGSGTRFHLRELVAPTSDEQGTLTGAMIVAQSLESTDHALSRIRFWILLVGGTGIAAGTALAAFVATAALRPVRRLTAAAENVAATGDLTERVETTGSDELGRLGRRFNGMLAALEESVGRQRRLVADASHELRTPLTAARTNVDLLREGKLPEEEARRALDEASIELNALTTLVSDLVELARGEERKLRVEDVQLDELVEGVVERAKSRTPGATFVTLLTPTKVRVDPVLLERAVSNLLDNAVKYSPKGAPIEVIVRDGEVIVADHGPGVADEDIPRIFDRFYRAAASRSKPGAGLGLAIVREAAEAHGGNASVESSAGGARFKLTLPASV
ncbi:MAG TPA: HAMP domain-containing sensor histidine kinase [Gaiellaceae bacterium]|jgi:two-component system sensor histidine kinase MprB|nr:HAMP domain-containing sensor histidine kinase [Gaiellaceae bacterium]